MFRRKKDKKREDPRERDEEARVRLARHIGELWHELQRIACEEDPRFETVSVVEYARQGREPLRDLQRWLEIYQRRIDPENRGFEFPPHYPRYRGYCLIPRLWPDGVLWEAFHEETLIRLRVPGQPDEESLRRRIDEVLTVEPGGD